MHNLTCIISLVDTAFKNMYIIEHLDVFGDIDGQ